MFPFVSDSQADWQLATAQIDIWRFRLYQDPTSLSSCLSKHEIERAKRFHFPKHQRRFQVARATLRHILSHYLTIKPEAITFQYEPNGKPTVVSPLPLTFNLSHTGDYACLGIGLSMPLGIDVEQFSARHYLGIGRHVFSKTEQQQLQNIPDYLLPLAFFSLWSQKEAVIKCIGLGMKYPLKELTLPLFSSPGEVFIDAVDNKPRKIYRFTPFIGTAAAICCHPHVTTLRFFDWGS
jgi:4'-phosphopantetheinyl transferase